VKNIHGISSYFPFYAAFFRTNHWDLHVTYLSR